MSVKYYITRIICVLVASIILTMYWGWRLYAKDMSNAKSDKGFDINNLTA